MDERFSYPSAELRPPAQVPTLYPVSFWVRAKAMLLDGFLLGIAAGGIDRLANAFPKWPAGGRIVGVASALVWWIYYVWAYSTSGQTMGKKWAGIKVVSIDGSPLNWRKGVLRTLGYLLSEFPPLINLGYLWTIWDPDKQAWHDKLAGTRVVPALSSDEAVRVAFKQSALRPHRPDRWKWAAGASVALTLVPVACLAYLWITAPQIDPQLHDDEWTQLENALMARVNPDSRIPSFRTYRDYGIESGTAHDIWLVMEMTYDADCEPEAVDWCYRLTNELVKMVFDNYPHIDEIDGIHVVMTKTTKIGIVDYEITPVDEKLTINEWRQRLSISEP